MIVLFLIFWYIIGVYGFIFWWTMDFDFEVEDVPMALVVAFAGPITCIYGYFIHGKTNYRNKVLIKHRQR